MEKLNEDKPFLKGERLTNRMAELADMTRTEHAEAQAASQNTLEHGRNAGEWLIEAKWRTGHRTRWGRWKRWLAKEYNISTRTMSQYMQIARHWDDPRINEVRTQGFTIDSIAGYLEVLRGHHPKERPAPTPKEEARDCNQKKMRSDFAKYLRTLDVFETGVLFDTFDDILETINTDLRKRVRGNYEGPYYDYRDEATNPKAKTARHTGPPIRNPRRQVRRPRRATGTG